MGIVRQKVKISYQTNNRNWRFSCKNGLCTIQLAFVALKALKWALKGQELASDTLESLLANAYHWNPCWKVDEMSHFWLLPFYFHKSTTFFVTYTLPWHPHFWRFLTFAILCLPSLLSRLMFLKEGGDFQPITELSSVRWQFSANHRALVSKVAIFNQSQWRWLRHRSPEGVASREISPWCK